MNRPSSNSGALKSAWPLGAITSEPPQNEIDSSTPTRLQNTTNDVVSWAYVRISVRHEVAVPEPDLVRRREVAARRRGDVDQDLGAVEGEQLGHVRCQKSSQTASPTPDPEPRRRRPQEIARGEEPPLVEQAVRRQEQLPVDVPDLAVLEQRRRDEQAVVGRLLDERDDGRQAVGRGGERRQARIVEAHRDLRREVLEQVAGQAELREDDEAGAAARASSSSSWWRARFASSMPEPGRDLGEGDPERSARRRA